MKTAENCRVLIVDDEALIRQGIKYFINWEQEGFEIVGEAANGQEALSLIAVLEPHIVITDIVMPVMDGDELTKAIKARYPAIEVIVLSSFSEFDYVRSTFQSGVADYILKPKLDMQHLLTVLKMTAALIPGLSNSSEEAGSEQQEREVSAAFVLESLWHGYDTVYEATVLNRLFPHPYCCLVAMRQIHGDKQAMQCMLEPVIERLEVYAEGPFDSQPVYYLMPEPGQALICLLNGNLTHMKALEKALGQLAKTAGSEEKHQLIAMSELFSEPQQVGGPYKQKVLQLLDYAFYLPEIRLLTEKQLPPVGEAPESFQLSRFTEGLKHGQFEREFTYLRTHVAQLAAYYPLEVFQFKTFLGNIIFNITVLLGNMSYDTKLLESAKYQYFRKIEEAENANAAVSCLHAFLQEVEVAVASKEDSGSNENMKRLLQYIDQKYAEPLTLTEVARHFHFNPSYLSSYFSTHNGEGFVEYLHKVRTEKAEELLRSSDAPISEIGGLVGYSDHSYFCKVFKKKTGLSPSKYRREHAGG